MKLVVKEAEKRTTIWQDNHKRIDKAIALYCTNLTEKGITEEMASESKVT